MTIETAVGKDVRRISLRCGESLVIETLPAEEPVFETEMPSDSESDLRRFVMCNIELVMRLVTKQPEEDLDLHMMAGEDEILGLIGLVRKEKMHPQKFLDIVVGTLANAPRNNMTPKQMGEVAQALFHFFATIAEGVPKVAR